MKRPLRAEVQRLAASQYGLISTWQLQALGLTGRQIRSLRERDQIVSFRRGVLRIPGSPVSAVASVIAACLAAGPEGIASHWAAASIWGLKGCAGGTLEVTVPRRTRVRLVGVRVHLAEHPLAKEDWTRHNGIPVTTPARTILDLAGRRAKPWLVERMLDDATVRRMLTLEDLAASVDRAGFRHRGRSTVLPILDARRTEWGQRFDSVFELRVARTLRAAGLPTPVLHLLVDTDLGTFEIDFAWPDRMVGLDPQGFAPHGTRSAFDPDARRALAFKRAGWHVQVVTPAMSDDEIVAAARTVLAAGRDSAADYGPATPAVRAEALERR